MKAKKITVPAPVKTTMDRMQAHPDGTPNKMLVTSKADLEFKVWLQIGCDKCPTLQQGRAGQKQGDRIADAIEKGDGEIMLGLEDFAVANQAVDRDWGEVNRLLGTFYAAMDNAEEVDVEEKKDTVPLKE